MEQLVVERDTVTPNLNTHGTDEQLELYALGRLPDSQHAFLEEHLLLCASCREKLDGIGDFALSMRGVGAQTVTPGTEEPFPGPGWSAFLKRPAVSISIAFALLLIVLGIFSIGRTGPAPVASLELTAVRGAMPVAAPARSYSILLTDAPPGGGPFRAELVNPAGERVWSGFTADGPSGVQVHVPRRLEQSDYFLRVSSADGKILREYGFRVR